MGSEHGARASIGLHEPPRVLATIIQKDLHAKGSRAGSSLPGRSMGSSHQGGVWRENISSRAY